jgi:hypothetical protein
MINGLADLLSEVIHLIWMALGSAAMVRCSMHRLGPPHR